MIKELSREKPRIKAQNFKKPFGNSSYQFKLKEKEVIKVTKGYITSDFSLLPSGTV